MINAFLGHKNEEKSGHHLPEIALKRSALSQNELFILDIEHEQEQT